MSQVLRPSKILGDVKEGRYADTIIKRDITPLQMEEIRDLIKLQDRKRLESRKTDMQTNWVLKKGTVLNTARGIQRNSRGRRCGPRNFTDQSS